VFGGLPNLFDHVSGVATRMRQRGSLQVVVYHLLGDILNAAEYALTHYFPLTLAEPFLQNSSIGTPYQKWAKFTNEDFQKVDHCIRRLVPAAWECYEDAEEPSASTKDAWHWFYSLLTAYNCCVVDPGMPALTLTMLHLDGWVDAVGGRFRNVVNRPDWERTEPPPPILTKSACDISDRQAIADLQRVGLTRLEEMRRLNARFAGWIRAHCTMEEMTAPHRGTLSDHCLG
jgi:hypothetical protein